MDHGVHVVIRMMSTVYQTRPVVFVGSEPLTPYDGRHFTVYSQRPFVDGRITQAAREAVVSTVKKAVQKYGFRMCAIFGENDCAYVELDGSVHKDWPAPDGGVGLNLNFERTEPSD